MAEKCSNADARSFWNVLLGHADSEHVRVGSSELLQLAELYQWVELGPRLCAVSTPHLEELPKPGKKYGPCTFCRVRAKHLRTKLSARNEMRLRVS